MKGHGCTLIRFLHFLENHSHISLFNHSSGCIDTQPTTLVHSPHHEYSYEKEKIQPISEIDFDFEWFVLKQKGSKNLIMISNLARDTPKSQFQKNVNIQKAGHLKKSGVVGNFGNTLSFSAAISACQKSGQWQGVVPLLHDAQGGF